MIRSLIAVLAAAVLTAPFAHAQTPGGEAAPALDRAGSEGEGAETGARPEASPGEGAGGASGRGRTVTTGSSAGASPAGPGAVAAEIGRAHV